CRAVRGVGGPASLLLNQRRGGARYASASPATRLTYAAPRCPARARGGHYARAGEETRRALADGGRDARRPAALHARAVASIFRCVRFRGGLLLTSCVFALAACQQRAR